MRSNLVYTAKPTAAAVTLTLEAAREVACPGGETVFTCTAASNATILSLSWREAGSPVTRVSYFRDSTGTVVVGDPAIEEFAGFTTSARTVNTLLLQSTATLRRVLFNYSMFEIVCSSGSLSHQVVVRIAGS